MIRKAIRIVTDPELLPSAAPTLLEEVAHSRREDKRPAAAETRVASISSRALAESTDKVIAIGASTGGTEAIREVSER